MLLLSSIMGLWSWIVLDPQSKSIEVALIEDDQDSEFVEAAIEPLQPLEPDRPPVEPELVEQELPPEPPEELFPDPPAPEPLDWLPPDHSLEDIEPWMPEPEAEPVVVEVATPEPQPQLPSPAEPAVLEGENIPTTSIAPQPSYPRQALRMGWEGSVTLMIAVDPEGLVVSAEVEQSSGHSVLDEAAMKAFRRWVFRPRQQGEPERRRIRKRFTFQLP